MGSIDRPVLAVGVSVLVVLVAVVATVFGTMGACAPAEPVGNREIPADTTIDSVRLTHIEITRGSCGYRIPTIPAALGLAGLVPIYRRL